MLYTYQECMDKYGSDYKIKKEIKNKNLFCKEKGIYSDKEYVSELAVISKKYPDAIFTLNSAFYYQGLTDTIPEYYYLATRRGKRKITDSRVIHIFENSDELKSGAITMEYDGVPIQIYNKERLLIELIRNKRKISFDLYKEIINNYREQIEVLNVTEIIDYVMVFPKSNMIMETIRMEVF